MVGYLAGDASQPVPHPPASRLCFGSGLRKTPETPVGILKETPARTAFALPAHFLRIGPVTPERSCSMSRHPLCNRIRSAPVRWFSAARWLGASLPGGLLALSVAVPAAAQTATVGGALVNQESRTPIEGARVSIVGTSLGASSDAQGRFQVAGVPAGVRVLQVHAIGFSVGSWVVQLDEGQNFHQTFELAPRTLEVEGVTVSGREEDTWRSERGFEERRRRGQGFFVTREQILQRNAPTVAELLRTVPSVLNICNSRGCQTRLPSSTGPCSPEFFLDGYPATFSTGPNFPLTQIRGVEVYRDQFSVPAEFQRPNLRCGVIAIWTIEPGTALGRH
jgi:hypothetical protein